MPDIHSGSSDLGTEDGISHQLLMATMNAAIDGIVVICDKAIVRMFNTGAEKLFGYTAKEVLGRNVSLLMPEPFRHEHDAYVNRYLTTGEKRVIGIGRRVQAINKDGEVFPIHLSLSEFSTQGARMFVGIARDMRVESNLESRLDEEKQISRRLQQKLRRVYQSSVLAELVASIAHEINQPLAAITTYADVSRRVLNNDTVQLDALESNLRKISAQALRAGDVIRQMRDLAPSTRLVSETARVGEFITELMDIIEAEASDAGSNVRLVLENGLPAVRANSTQIQHVLLLLLRNSLESLATDADRENGIRIAASRHSGDFIQLAVVDHGSGIEPAKLDTLYHPFTSNKAEKVGIGLSICNTIIGNHGGRIWHEPNPAGGSQFIFTLPVHRHLGISP